MPQSPSILIVAKDEASFEALRICLSDPGKAFSATRAEEAQKIVEAREIPILLVEISCPGNIEALLASALKADEDAQIIILSDSSQEALASQCLKLGACDLVSAPWNPELIRLVSDRCVETYLLRRQIKRFNADLPKPESMALMGSSLKIRALCERVIKLPAHNASVLISGESGTGKRRVAQWIHAQSPVQGGRFLVFECGARAAKDQAKMLFGYAGDSGLGAMEAAEGGSLYLHDVDALDLDVQEQLQRVLREREFRRVDSRRAIHLDLRIISSTRINLRNAVHQNKFREDLYWKLCTVALEIPPLRERGGDIEELLQFFIDQETKDLDKKSPEISSVLMNMLRAHAYPGNVRELKHLAGILAALSENGEITLGALPAQIMTPLKLSNNAPMGALALKPIVHAFEKQFLVRTLKAVGGNQSRAARILDIHRNTLILKMQELGIPNKRSKSKTK
jgi:two-component system response regulator HydG